MKQRIGTLVGSFWRQALVYGIVWAVVIGVLWWHLGTLVPGMSLPEQVARANANAFHKLFDNPLYLPHKSLQYLFIRAGHSGPFWMRTASAIWGAAIIAVFYDIIRSWYTRRIALMSGALLLTSAWFLHFARLGTPYIMFATSIGLLWIGMKLKSSTSPRIRTILASIAILTTCIYVPGLAWLIVPMVIWQRKLIWHEFSRIPRTVAALTAVLGVMAFAPLIYGFARHPRLIFDWLLIPTHLQLSSYLSNLWHIPVWLILRGPEYPVYWLGHVPMLDSFSLVMGILGIFVLSYYRLLDRVRAIAVIIALGLILTIFNGWLAMVIALPLLFVVMAAGIALFLQQWFTVFPINPLARAVGIGLVTFVVALACFYNIRHYFVAWPRNAETIQAFSFEPQVAD